MITKKPEIIRKNNIINEAVLNVSSDPYKVYLLTLKKIGYEHKDPIIQIDKLNQEHTISVAEYASLFDSDMGFDNCYRNLKQACQKLIRTPLVLPKLDSKQVWEIPVYSIIKYCENQGRIKFKFSQEIIPYLSQVDAQYTKYDLRIAYGMYSVYAIKLYERIMQFKNTGWVYMTLEELRHLLVLSKKLELYGDLKRRVIDVTIQSINAHHSDIELSFEEIKESHSVVAIKFNFNKKVKMPYIDEIITIEDGK